jgi:hypothetical protein
MGKFAHIPTSLKIVAALFMLVGVLSAIDIVVALTRGYIELNFHVLGLLIGPGLLWLKRGWRTCALVVLWITMIIIVILAANLIGHPIPLTTFWLLVATVAFALTFWQYRVLTRPDIRRLFGVGVEADEPASGV